MRATWIGIAAFAVIAFPATAKNQAAKTAEDPDEMICEKVRVLGSRLATKKVCATRAQWAERRKEDRDAIDRAQLSPNGPCQSINTHTGAPGC